MSFRLKLAALALAAGSLTACATTTFVSTWKSPDAQPLKPEGSKVAAMVMNKNEGSRRAAEDALAREITKRGGQGVPSYTLIPGSAPTREVRSSANAVRLSGVHCVPGMDRLRVSR